MVSEEKQNIEGKLRALKRVLILMIEMLGAGWTSFTLQCVIYFLNLLHVKREMFVDKSIDQAQFAFSVLAWIFASGFFSGLKGVVFQRTSSKNVTPVKLLENKMSKVDSQGQERATILL